MAFPGSTYAPPGVYTQTLFENPLSGQIDLLRIPVLIGEGSELIPQSNLEVIRGSSSSVDQQVYLEDATGRAVAAVLDDGSVTLGDFDGNYTKLQVRNYPIVNGQGSGTTTNDRSAVQVRINNQPIVVRSVSGATGIIELAQAPKAGDLVRVTYFFNRTDTLITDDLSSQVTDDTAKIFAELGIEDSSLGGSEVFSVEEDSTDTLILIVDGESLTIVIPELSSGYTAQNMVTLINSAATSTSLVASSTVNNQGKKSLLLTADKSLKIGGGTANAILGLITGKETSRNKVFYTNQGPIVDGSNGGVTTTDVSDVTVKVDGVQVIPAEVNGQTRAVTLEVAPKKGSIVTIQYYFNSWQDTFDYLANINISSITQCGITANSNDYIDGADFVLSNDKVVWGTAALASSGTASTGAELFDDTQVSLSLVDNQVFMAQCLSVTDTTGTLPVTSNVKFRLPYQPTTGNGRNSPLGQSLFQTVANGRIDLPTNRPDLVKAYWGYSIGDAIEKGEVTVTSVDSATSIITLAEEVPVGATVYATFYYNTLTDSEYILTCTTEGASSIGEYTVTKNGSDFYNASFDISSKSAGLSVVTLQFPSGSELKPDVRLEGGTPVEEVVTVTFKGSMEHYAKIVVSNSSPYYFVEGKSDSAQLKIDGQTSVVVNLSDSHTNGFGHPASIVAGEVSYDADSTSQTKDVDSTNNTVSLDVDGVVISATIKSGTKGVDEVATALNAAAMGASFSATGGSATTIILDSAEEIVCEEDGYYVGWEVIITAHANDATLAGQKFTVTDYDGSTQTLTIADVGAAFQNGDTIYLYNPNARPVYKGSSKFLGAMKLGGGDGYHKLTIDYTGATSGALQQTITIPTTTYQTVSAIADAINLQIKNVGTFATDDTTNAQNAFSKPQILAFGTTSGEIGFKFVSHPDDASSSGGAFAFQADGTAHDDFCLIAGIDASTLGYGGEGVHIIHGPVATSVTYGISYDLYDRLVFRNRILCGGGGSAASSTTAHNALAQTKLVILAGTANSTFSLETGDYGSASAGAVVNPATLVANIGNGNQITSGGGNTQGEAFVTFYDGAGTKAQNNILRLTIDGKICEVEFDASASGTNAPIGSGDGQQSQHSSSIIQQIKDKLGGLTDAPFGTANSATMATVVRREGFGIRLTSLKTDSKSKIIVGDGSANSILGLTDGTTVMLSPTTAKETASVLMADTSSAGNLIFGSGNDYQANGVSASTPTDLASEAIIYVEEDEAGQEYLAVQSLTVGVSSSVVLESASANDWLSYGTMIGAEDGDSAIGEGATSGFCVTSNNSDGSGTSNSSVYNNGSGQDGTVGQTYMDGVTGLTFTILPRLGGGTYAVNESFQFTVSKTFVTDANYAVHLNGAEMIVSNTIGVTAGDTCVVETYERGGNQPEIGEPYSISYLYQKESFETQLFTKMSAIETAMGEISPENPLALASYLAILNGAVLVALKQVQKAENSTQGTIASYLEALSDIEGKIAGQVSPNVIVPLRTDSTPFLEELSKHTKVQSTITNQSERTAIVGASAGTDVKTIGLIAQSLSNTRMRIVYPDSVIVPVTDTLGQTKEYLVDGTYLAAAMVGNRVSPNRDVASPWTGAQLVGFTQLGRILDAVEMNQATVKGLTILDSRPPFLRVRHGVTTDMTSILTKLPTIIQIADEVHKQCRQVLNRFVGIKFLPGVVSQIEGRLSQMMIGLVNAQIITSFTGISANISAEDQTVAEVEVYYQPVYPLLYLVVTFNVRSSL